MKVIAFERNLQGTGASRRLRKAGKTPGIIYGGTASPQAIELDHNALFHALKKEAFHASILDLELAGQSQKVLLRDFQMHPFKQLVLHIDFQRVDPKQKIHVKVPLHFIGTESAPAIKSGGIVSHVHTELEIQCLPADLPEFLNVDMSKLEIGQSIHAKDIPLPQNVVLIQHIEVENPVVATIKLPNAEKSAAADNAATAGTDNKDGAAPAA